MIKEKDQERTVNALILSGFSNPESKLKNRPHHLAPFSCCQKICGIEVHLKSYNYFFENSIPDVIWNDSENVLFMSELIKVPSITDHAWILLRKDLVNRILNPKFCDFIEILLIKSSGHMIKQETIVKRATLENIPNLINNASFNTLKDIRSCYNNTVSKQRHEIFIKESMKYIKLKHNEKTFFMHFKNFCASR